MNSWPPVSWMLTAGVALLVASFATPLLLPARGAWTNAKAEAYNHSRAELHNLSHKLSQAHNAQDRAKVGQAITEAKAQVARHQQALEQARNRADLPTWLLRIAGALVIVTGLATYARNNNLFG